MDAGYTTYTCSKCGNSYEDNRTEPLGHNEVEIVVKEAECETVGLKEIRCSVCYILIESEDNEDLSPLTELSEKVDEVVEDEELTLEEKVEELKNITADIQQIINNNVTVVTRDLAELLTNSVNMVNKYYEIFFDPNPHYVELQQYNSNGELVSTMIPNRSLDKAIALSGEGSPEGIIEAHVGVLYIDNVSRDLYIKKVGNGTLGWNNITPKKINVYTEEFTIDADDNTTTIENVTHTLRHTTSEKSMIDVYCDGVHLSPDTFELDIDGQTVMFNQALPVNKTIAIRYVSGLYGVAGEKGEKGDKGDTGPQGPTGPAGAQPDMRNYYTRDEVNALLYNLTGGGGELGTVIHKLEFNYSAGKYWYSMSRNAPYYAQPAGNTFIIPPKTPSPWYAGKRAAILPYYLSVALDNPDNLDYTNNYPYNKTHADYVHYGNPSSHEINHGAISVYDDECFKPMYNREIWQYIYHDVDDPWTEYICYMFKTDSTFTQYLTRGVFTGWSISRFNSGGGLSGFVPVFCKLLDPVSHSWGATASTKGINVKVKFAVIALND